MVTVIKCLAVWMDDKSCYVATLHITLNSQPSIIKLFLLQLALGLLYCCCCYN